MRLFNLDKTFDGKTFLLEPQLITTNMIKIMSVVMIILTIATLSMIMLMMMTMMMTFKVFQLGLDF